jgi:hypothetical protein
MTDQELLRQWAVNTFRSEVRENPSKWEDRGDDEFAYYNDEEVYVFSVKEGWVFVTMDSPTETGFYDLRFRQVIDCDFFAGSRG